MLTKINNTGILICNKKTPLAMSRVLMFGRYQASDGAGYRMRALSPLRYPLSTLSARLCVCVTTGISLTVPHNRANPGGGFRVDTRLDQNVRPLEGRESTTYSVLAIVRRHMHGEQIALTGYGFPLPQAPEPTT